MDGEFGMGFVGDVAESVVRLVGFVVGLLELWLRGEGIVSERGIGYK